MPYIRFEEKPGRPIWLDSQPDWPSTNGGQHRRDEDRDYTALGGIQTTGSLFFVASCTFLRGRGLGILPVLNHLVVATGAIAMESLLIV